MIACEAIALSVNAATQRERVILHALSMQAEAGTITLVRGPSGAGKSTLMSIVAGVLRPTEGQVTFNGEPISRYTAAHRDRFRQKMGLVPQRLHLFDELTPPENVLLPKLPQGRVDPGGATRLLERLEVPFTHGQRTGTLSGGEQQRVAIARALLGKPALLVVDEPTAHQDDDRAELILQLLSSAATDGAIVLMAAHDPRVASNPAIGACYRLDAGRLEPIDREDTPRGE